MSDRSTLDLRVATLTRRQQTSRPRRIASLRSVAVSSSPPVGRLGGMADVTRLLDAAAAGDPKPPRICSRSSTTSCGSSPPRDWRARSPARPCRPPPSSTRRTCGWSAATQPHWNGRGHFFAAAAEAMRRILVENARRKGRVRHGGGARRVDLRADVGPSSLRHRRPARPRRGADPAGRRSTPPRRTGQVAVLRRADHAGGRRGLGVSARDGRAVLGVRPHLAVRRTDRRRPAHDPAAEKSART